MRINVIFGIIFTNERDLVMTKSNYLKNFAESFAIFAKYEPSDILDLDYNTIEVPIVGPVSPEDHARLLELGWSAGFYGGYFKNERGKDYS
jgi:hypothetical protein